MLVKDTDGNIINWGPRGATWVWIANQGSLLLV